LSPLIKREKEENNDCFYLERMTKEKRQIRDGELVSCS
jgi:hypothetical protein